MEHERAEAELSGGDWLVAVLSFFLTPLVPLLLAIYNFIRGRKKRGLLYLSVCGVGLLAIFVLAAARA